MRTLGTALLAIALIAQASATLTQVGTRAALGATDSIDWSSVGPELSVLSDPYFGTTAGSKVFKATGGGQTFVEGSFANGNFAIGDSLVISNSGFAITYAGSQRSVGTQIQADFYGAYTAQMDVYDNLNILLGSFQVTGISFFNEDNSAPFLGVTSTSADIAKVVFSLIDDNPIVINRVDSDCGCGAVPEPASMAALGMGAIALVRRRRKA